MVAYQKSIRNCNIIGKRTKNQIISLVTDCPKKGKFTLILRYLVDVAHSLQIATDRFLINAILDGKLSQGLLPFDIIRYDLGFISSDST